MTTLKIDKKKFNPIWKLKKVFNIFKENLLALIN
jgi:hypothetical protein